MGPRSAPKCYFKTAEAREIKTSEVPAFVTEEGNPGNTLQVKAALFHLDAPLLAGGMRLVDTPGVGSVFGLNSAVTKAFLPRIDVALIVLGGDPPITGDELELVRAAAPRAGMLLFVMNKADLLDDETRTKAEAFSRKVLSEALGQDPGPFLMVSARGALRGQNDSGVGELKAVLENLVQDAGPQLAALAEAASLEYFAGRLRQDIALERRALLTPIEEMEARIQRFKDAVQDVEDLALAVPARLARSGGPDAREDEARREEFLRQEEDKGLNRIREALTGAQSRAEARRLVQPLTEDLARGSVAAWLGQVSEEASRLLAEKAARMEAETARLAGRVEQAASECFDVPVAPCEIRRPELDFERIPFEFSAGLGPGSQGLALSAAGVVPAGPAGQSARASWGAGASPRLAPRECSRHRGPPRGGRGRRRSGASAGDDGRPAPSGEEHSRDLGRGDSPEGPRRAGGI